MRTRRIATRKRVAKEKVDVVDTLRGIVLGRDIDLGCHTKTITKFFGKKEIPLTEDNILNFANHLLLTEPLTYIFDDLVEELQNEGFLKYYRIDKYFKQWRKLENEVFQEIGERIKNGEAPEWARVNRTRQNYFKDIGQCQFEDWSEEEKRAYLQTCADVFIQYVMPEIKTKQTVSGFWS